MHLDSHSVIEVSFGRDRRSGPTCPNSDDIGQISTLDAVFDIYTSSTIETPCSLDAQNESRSKMADPDTQPSSSRRPPTFQRALMVCSTFPTFPTLQIALWSYVLLSYPMLTLAVWRRIRGRRRLPALPTGHGQNAHPVVAGVLALRGVLGRLQRRRKCGDGVRAWCSGILRLVRDVQDACTGTARG